MQWAVEARIFNNGKVVSKVRKAEEGEENSHRETRSCDIWIDLFETQQEAIQFNADYRK